MVKGGCFNLIFGRDEMILKPEDPHQMFFTSRADLVASEELVLVIDEVVNRLDLRPLYQLWSESGRGFYDPAMMLKILFFTYCEGERRSREIAKRIRYDIRYQYFAGSRRPKFRSICRFRVISPALLAGYFVEIVRICQDLALTDNSLLAIDGTKLKASASRKRTIKRKDLDRLRERYRQMLSEDAVLDERELAAGDGSDDEPDEGDSSSEKKAFSSLELKKRVEAAIKRLSEGEREVNLTDGDAKLMKTSDGGIRPAFNAQVAVEANQIIVAADISQNADDGASLAPMIEQSRKNLEEDEDTILADGGYYSASNMQYIEAEKLDVYMPMGKCHGQCRGKFSADDFRYEESEDCFICPAGQRLKYIYSRIRDGVRKRIYRCARSKCRVCDYKMGCTKDKYRALEISEVWKSEQAMKQKLSSAEGAALYGRRKVLVEPVFGNMKFNLGFGRFLLRGLERVKGEFLLMCIAHNLKKIARQTSHLRPALAQNSSHFLSFYSQIDLIFVRIIKMIIPKENSITKLKFA
jgi:transposase/IS5 family transposase